MAEPEIDRREDEAHALDPDRVEAIVEAVEAGDAPLVDTLLEPLHAADIADLLEQISPAERQALIALWSGGIDGEILSELGEGVREEVIGALPQEVLANAVRELDSDDVVDILEDLEEPQQRQVLDALDDADRIAVEQAMAYPEYTAGRLMQREVVTAPEDWTVGHAIDFLRTEEWLPDQFYHVVLIDPRHRPVGYVALGKMLASRRDRRLTEITEDSYRTIPATQSQEDVAYAFNQYHLISAPVVDADGRLVGVITIDDAMTVLEEEAEEDILRLGGVGDETLSDGVFETVRLRFPWLFVNLIAINLSALVIGHFETAIAQIVALAAIMPIIASMGGNTGTQTLTIAVRALATKDLTSSNALRVVRRELMVGAMNGLIFAAIMATVGWLGYGSAMLGAVTAAAMVINLIVAAIAGTLIPLTLNRIGLDPALASGTFVTMTTDAVGFFCFLALASAVLL